MQTATAMTFDRRGCRGVTTVEFAVIATVLMILLFYIFEYGRALYVMNALTEASRRGARMATVCPVGDPKPASVAVFDSGNGSSSLVAGLTTGNILVQYLDTSGTVIANPGNNFTAISYVQVSVVGFTLSPFLPSIMPGLSMAGFTTTLPRESLGIPRSGTVTPC